jgi:hypothetical protein
MTIGWSEEEIAQIITRTDSHMKNETSKREVDDLIRRRPGRPSKNAPLANNAHKDTHYKGYEHLSPFSNLNGYNCCASIVIDGMHAISNIVRHVINLTSGKNINRVKSKQTDEKIKQQRLVEQLEQWKLDKDHQDLVISRYERLGKAAPTDFIEKGKGPYQLGNDLTLG